MKTFACTTSHNKLGDLHKGKSIRIQTYMHMCEIDFSSLIIKMCIDRQFLMKLHMHLNFSKPFHTRAIPAKDACTLIPQLVEINFAEHPTSSVCYIMPGCSYGVCSTRSNCELENQPFLKDKSAEMWGCSDNCNYNSTFNLCHQISASFCLHQHDIVHT